MRSLLRWERDDDPDAEYGQQIMKTPSGRLLFVFSNRDGDEWGYAVGTGEAQFGCDTESEAMSAAEQAAKEAGLW